MISIEDRKLFARAEQKAREVCPRVSMVRFGEYKVASGSQEGTSYTVTFSKDNTGHWQAECECAAHVKSSKPRACFHIVSAYASLRIQVNILKQVRAAQAVPAVEKCVTCPEQPTYTAEMAAKDRADLGI